MTSYLSWFTSLNQRIASAKGQLFPLHNVVGAGTVQRHLFHDLVTPGGA